MEQKHLVIFLVIFSVTNVDAKRKLNVPEHAPGFEPDEHDVFVSDGEEKELDEESGGDEDDATLQQLEDEEKALEEAQAEKLMNELKHLEHQDELEALKETANEKKTAKKASSKDTSTQEKKKAKKTKKKEKTKESSDLTIRRRRKRSASIEHRFWQNCIVPYAFSPDEKASDIVIYKIGLDIVSRRTCIKFVEWDSETKTKYNLDHDGYVLFKRVLGRWGFASLGNTKAPGQTLSSHGLENCIHEILHALGFNHEQKDPRRTGIIRINWKNISPNLLNEYKNLPSPEVDDVKEPYDISSTLHYGLQYGPAPEMTLLYPELSIQTGSYYQFREVAEAYKCKERFCADYMACENDGYVIHVNDACECVCPEGLDPATGCTTILRAESKATDFPSGQYALPAPKEGCPNGQGFAEGSLDHRFPYTYAFHPYLLKGEASWGPVHQYFCVKEDAGETGEWPAGTYCIYRYGGTCPQGFEESWMQFDNKYGTTGLQAAVTEGKVADGVFDENSKFFFCCRQDRGTDFPIQLPANSPFALFPISQCQKVTGAKEVQGEYIMKSDDGDGVFGYSAGSLPNFWTNNAVDAVVYLRYCAYHPMNDDCGGVINLSENNRKAEITSPNYPENYDNNLLCHWFIQGPENSTVTLKFEDFDIEGNPGRCQDRVEISTYMIGQSGASYCGNHMARTHRSILNRLHVTFNTGSSGQRKGFKAIAEVHLGDEDCFNHKDFGKTYRGRVDYTEEFKTCLPWSDPGLKQCHHFATNPLDINAGLESNYCRNPGDGVRPWCYTNATNCQRGYCDVCQIDGIYDKDKDCAALLAAESDFCKDEKVAREKCALSCKDSLPAPETPKPYTTVKCPAPETPSDGEPTSSLKDSYGVGDTVSFRCTQTSSSWTQTSTCLADGTWSPLTSVCTGCPEGWFPFEDSCHWVSTTFETFEDAKAKCAEMGAELAEIRSQRAMDVFFHVRDDGLDQWLGLKEEGKDNWRWQDGSPLAWDKWTDENRYSQSDSSNDYCAVLRFTDDWHDTICTSKLHFNCRRVFQEAPPKPTAEACSDHLSDCKDRADGGECETNAGYMKDNCPKSCNACPKPCTDSLEHCAWWASTGCCVSYFGFMKYNCPKSCDFCPPPCRDKSYQCAEWQEEGKCEANRAEMTAKCQSTCNRCPENCVDLSTDCAARASSGDCESNADYMNQHCNKSCNLCPEPGECPERPCGDNKCLLVEGQPKCMCPVGFYGDNCEGTFDCVDRAGSAYCRDRVAESPNICKDFPEFSWYMCKRTCGKCAVFNM